MEGVNCICDDIFGTSCTTHTWACGTTSTWTCGTCCTRTWTCGASVIGAWSGHIVERGMDTSALWTELEHCGDLQTPIGSGLTAKVVSHPGTELPCQTLPATTPRQTVHGPAAHKDLTSSASYLSEFTTFKWSHLARQYISIRRCSLLLFNYYLNPG